MRRSSSASQIPLRSRSSVRSSGDRGEKRTRSGSIEAARRSGPVKKSGLLFPRKQSGVNTPKVLLSSAVRGSGSKARLVTPLSTGLKSPFKTNVNDKKWVSKQYAKVMQFLSEMYFADCDQVVDLKPPTLSSFAYVVNHLMKEIDPRVEITESNYKDIVFNMLKSLRYPGSISMSLLKTVNTMHSWAQVVCMLSWLVDLVKLIKSVEDPSFNKLEDPKYQKIDYIIDYIIRRYTLYNSNDNEEIADEEFKNNFCQVWNINESDLEQHREAVFDLSQRKKKQTEEKTQIEATFNNISEEIDEKQKKIEAYHENAELKKSELDKKIEEAQTKLNKLRLSNAQKKKKNEDLRQTVDQQKYTSDDMKRLLSSIDSLKHTNGLMKNRHGLRHKMTIDYEENNRQLRKEIEKEVFRFNNSLLQHVAIEPELQKFELKYRDFLNSGTQFGKILEDLSGNLKTFETNTNKSIKNLRQIIQSINTKNDDLKQKIASNTEKIDNLEEENGSICEKIIEWKGEFVELQKRRENDKKKLKQDMNKLVNFQFDLEELEKKRSEVRSRRLDKEKSLADIKKEIFKFFIDLRKKSFMNAQSMVEIYNNVVQKVENAVEEINRIENEIEKDMHKLEEIENK